MRLEALCERSTSATPSFDWPDALQGELCFVPEWSLLPEHTLYEALSFFSWNIHGERALIRGAWQRMGRVEPELQTYLRHFIDEECAHSRVFARFCRRYGRIYPDTRIALGAPEASSVADAIFIGQIVTFEEIVDGLNRLHARDPRLVPIVRAIHRYHHLDERRHLAFGFEWLRRLEFEQRERWNAATRRRIGRSLAAWVRMLSIHRVQSEAMHDAGLDARAQRRVHEAAQQQHRRMRELLPRSQRVLARLDLLPEGGELVA